MRVVATIACLVLAACSPQAQMQTGTVPDLDGSFDFASLEIINDAGDSLVFDVYLAVDTEQHRRGLMFIREMPETTGMLFIYDSDEIRSMWMRNTFIPLDMVFARSDGSVTNIVTNTTPRSLRSSSSTEPVRYVLELNAGASGRFGIGQGSRLIWGDGYSVAAIASAR